MRKLKLIPFMLFNLLLLGWVPESALPAFDAPLPNPVSFSLANMASFPDYLNLPADSSKKYYLSTGGARLFGMPEIQPFFIRVSGYGLGGRWYLNGYGLRSGAYSEMNSGLVYVHPLIPALRGGMELQLLQIAIRDFGTARSSQINAWIQWQAQSHLQLAFTWINPTGARFGANNYPLPRRISAGAKLSLIPHTLLFLELEKDMLYPLSMRLGISYQPLRRVNLLLGLQSDPDILSAGISCLIGLIRATAAFQYHPDLGFSQCYGITVVF